VNHFDELFDRLSVRTVMHLGSSFLVPLLSHEVSQTLTSYLFFTPPSHAWELLFGLWIFFYIRSTIRGIYVSLFHQAILTFFMSLIGDQILFLIPGTRLTWEDGLDRYFWSSFVQFSSAIILLVLFSFLPEYITNAIINVSRTPAAVLGSAVQSRMFHRLPPIFTKSDDCLLLVASLILLQWNPIVDYLDHYLVGQRSISPFAQRSVVLRVGIAAAFVFALSRRSALSPFMGIYPFDPVVLLLFAAHVFFYLRVVFARKPSLNALQRGETIEGKAT
jgi:hypothetical protein